MEVVREGAAETVAILDEYTKINDQFGSEEVYSDADQNGNTSESSSRASRSN